MNAIPADPTRWLIVGLGNPEKKYAANRHNVGFHVIDRLAVKAGVSVTDRRFHGLFGRGRAGRHALLLFKPTTFMNASGNAVAAAARFYKIAPAQVAVVYDDIDLAFARLRLRAGGSHGGHRGVESVIAALGTRAFPRLRIGVGRPPAGVDPIAHVLSDFAAHEQPDIEKTIDLAAEAALSLVTAGLDKTMTRFNSRARAAAQPSACERKEPQPVTPPETQPVTPPER